MDNISPPEFGERIDIQQALVVGAARTMGAPSRETEAQINSMREGGLRAGEMEAASL